VRCGLPSGSAARPAALQFTAAGQIQAHDDTASRRFVFVTDAPDTWFVDTAMNRIARLRP
jgi:hypothetical protein